MFLCGVILIGYTRPAARTWLRILVGRDTKALTYGCLVIRGSPADVLEQIARFRMLRHMPGETCRDCVNRRLMRQHPGQRDAKSLG